MEKEIVLYREKVRRYYDAENKLKQYPSKKPMRILALTEIAQKFEKDRKYTEREVNEIIKSSIAFSDIELIRRELFQYRMIGRLRDGSQYWLEDNCIKALAQVGLAKPQYIPRILLCLRSADLSKYKDSMRPLIEKDIADTEKILTN